MKPLIFAAALLVPTLVAAQSPESPTITGSWINDGSPQRSMIQAVGVRFDRNVSDLIKPGALTLRNVKTGDLVDLSDALVRFDPKNNTASWIIDRSTTALLADGNYIAWFDTETLASERRRAACAASAAPLDAFVFGFHQYSGDSDGDRDVDFRDSCVLRQTWQQPFGSKRYLSHFDFNLSDIVEEFDRNLMTETYFTVLRAEPAIHLFLRNDTGDSYSDNATSLYNVAFGSIDTKGAVTWRASLDGGAASEITALVGNGSATLDKSFIDGLNRSPLAVGDHSIRVEALAADGSLLASDQLAFNYLGDVPCAPFFITTPPSGVSLGSVRGARPLSLADWTVENYPGSQGPAKWIIAPDGLSARQTINASPSVLLSPQSVLNLRITGTFRVDTSSDDDFMGFVFGYQNRDQFYIFDWKQRAQDRAKKGMSIKRYDRSAEDGPFTVDDFFSSVSNNRFTVIVDTDGIGWKDFQEYKVTLEFTPGRIIIEVFEEAVLLRRLETNDDTFSGGRFGFYNSSQDNVVYSGFTSERLDNVYYYDSEAEDPEGSAITYSFAPSPGNIPPPAGATINATNGTVLWQPSVAGTYPFTIVATNSAGLSDTQTFEVLVTPIDLPPVVIIKKTAPAVYPGEEVGIQAIATDDQQVFRTRLFIDDLEVNPNVGQVSVSTTRTFSTIGQVVIRAIAIDSADQVSEAISYLRVLDPNAAPPENPNQTQVAPPGQVVGTPTDIRPLVSFQAPLNNSDDPTRCVGTIDANGGTLAGWYLEWAPAARTVPGKLADPSVLWQEITRGTTPQAAAELATITPTNFPNELITFRLRAENTTGLGNIAAVTYNPRSASNSTATGTTGTGTGARPKVNFTAPLGPMADSSAIRGTINANGGTLRNWKLDYAPLGNVNTSNLSDPAVVWTILKQGSDTGTDLPLSSLDLTTFRSGVFVFRLSAVNQNGLGSLATLTYDPTASGFTDPGNATGTDPAAGARPIARIDSPRGPADDRGVLTGSILANGGTLERWVVDYATRGDVNPADLADPSVAWIQIAEGTAEKSSEALAPLDDPAFGTGVWVIRLRAFNTNGFGSLSSTILDSGDQSVPQVAFTSPEPNTDITYIIPVTGSVKQGSGTLASWKLEYASADQVSLTNLNAASSAWVQIGSGTSVMDNENLGTLDPTGLRNGSYVLRLSAFNNNGRGFADGRLVTVSGEAKLGNFRLEFEDLSLPLVGIPITVRRIYDTLDAGRDGDFGYGWSLALGDPDIRETIPDTGSDFFNATPFEVGTRVFITTPAGKRVGFTFKVRNPRNRFVATTYDPYFEPDPGVYEKLTIAASDYMQVELAEDGSVYEPLLPFGYNPDRYQLTTKDGLVYDYDQRRGLQRITDSSGQSVSFARNAITHSSGPKIDIFRDASGRITSIAAPDGSTIGYRYDANGDLVSATNQLDESTLFSYLPSPRHYLGTISNPADAALGKFTRRIVYEGGRVTKVEDGQGNPLSLQNYDASNFSGTKTDAEGNVTTLLYDRIGNITRLVSPEGAVTEFEYGDPRNPSKETARIDPNGQRYDRTYNAAGNITEELRPDGMRIINSYDSNNRLAGIQIYTASGQLETNESIQYGGNNLPSVITRTDGATQSFVYDVVGRPLTFTDYDGGTLNLTYEGGKEVPATITYPGGLVITQKTDSLGRITEIKDNTGNEITRSYDSSGRQILEARKNGSSISTVYGPDGYPSKVTDSLGRTTHTTYDDSGSVISQSFTATPALPTSADPTVSYERDKNGRLTTMTDPSGNQTQFAYNLDGKIIRITSATGGVTRYEYDAGGRATAVIDPRGLKRIFTFTTDDQIASETWLDSDGNEVNKITADFDDSGRLSVISDRFSRYVQTYNQLDYTTSISNSGSPGIPLLDLNFSYNSKGLRATATDNSETGIVYTYGAQGFLDSMSWTSATTKLGAVELKTDLEGSASSVIRRAGDSSSPVISRTINAFSPGNGFLESTRHLDSASNPIDANAEISFSYNSEGKMISKSRGGKTTNYSYDSGGQLTGASGSSGAAESYAYDISGNRIASHLLGTHVIGSGNRLLSDDRFSYAYDAAGNLVSRTEKSDGSKTIFEFDHRNRNTRIATESAGGTLLSERVFVYDVYNRIISRKTDGVVTLTVWDGIQPWADYDGAGNLIQRYLYGINVDSAYATWSPIVGTTWLLRDQIGTVDYELNAVGAITSNYRYDSFGNILSSNTPNLGYTSRPEQAGGFLNLRARLYDPLTGRFISPDPISINSGDWNPYRYVMNSPLTSRDPSGLFGLPDLSAVTSFISTFVRTSIPFGIRALQFAKSTAIAGAIGTLFVEVLDFSLSKAECGSKRSLKLVETIDKVLAGAADNIRTSANAYFGGKVPGVGGPLASIYSFATGPIYASLVSVTTRGAACLGVQEALEKFLSSTYRTFVLKRYDPDA